MEYDPVTNLVRFPQNPNPEAELQFLLSHPNARVCPSENPNLAGQAATVQTGMTQGYIDTMNVIRSWRGY